MRMTLMPNLWTHATPTDDDRPLAIAVEQVVRPLPLSPARKARIRDDLFSHLKSIHEEESTKGGTNEEIVARSLSRFGDPAEIATELRGDTTWGQAVGWRLSRIFDFRVSDSAEQFAFRFFVYIISLMVVLSLIVWPTKWLLTGAYQPREIGTSAIALSLSGLLVTMMIYCGIKFADTLFCERHRQVFSLSVFPLHISIQVDCWRQGSMVAWFLMLVSLYPAMHFAGNHFYGDRFLPTFPNGVFLVLTAAGTTLVGLAAGFGFVADRSYRQHWESLPIFSKEMAA